MPLSPEQLELRKNYLGASEASAVLGLSPFSTALDVWASKVGDLEPKPATDAMESGTRLEPVIIDWAAAKLGVQVERNCPTVLHKTLPLCATPDATVVGQSAIIEAKKTSYPDGWGDEMTDEIPAHYGVQAHQQCLVLGVERVYVPVLMLTGFREEWRLYVVNRNPDIEAVLAKRLTEWWQKYVVTKQAPAPGVPDEDFFKRLRRQPNSTVHLGEQAVQIVDQWETAKAAAKAADEAKDQAQAQVLALLGIEQPAECGILPDGRQIRYMQQRNPPSVDKDKLRAGWPDAFNECVTQTLRRQLRLTKPKERS